MVGPRRLFYKEDSLNCVLLSTQGEKVLVTYNLLVFYTHKHFQTKHVSEFLRMLAMSLCQPFKLLYTHILCSYQHQHLLEIRIQSSLLWNTKSTAMDCELLFLLVFQQQQSEEMEKFPEL